MKCKYHPEIEAVALCEKFNVGFCNECCAKETIDEDHPYCYCSSPKVHCKFRPQCVVYYKAKKREREQTNKETE